MIKWLELFKEIIAACTENHTKQNAELMIVKAVVYIVTTGLLMVNKRRKVTTAVFKQYNHSRRGILL
jgi:hypothetical protein